MIDRLIDTLKGILKGKEEVVELSVATLISGGHLLIEDLPGTGKTTFAMALAKATGCSFRKVQFTSDMLPADILGGEVYSPKDGKFYLQKGPIFTNILLADEINRATPRTQSALLEAMAEGQVSIGGKSHPLPSPFMVIATQNPLDLYGTYPLPESQLDRFLMRLSVGYPPAREELEILSMDGTYHKARTLKPIISKEELLRIQDEVKSIRVSEKVLEYILNIGERSRRDERFRYGLSTRGLLGLKRAAQAVAYIEGSDFVTPDHVKRVFGPVSYHRLIPKTPMDPEARMALLEDFLNGVPVPI